MSPKFPSNGFSYVSEKQQGPDGEMFLIGVFKSAQPFNQFSSEGNQLKISEEAADAFIYHQFSFQGHS